MTHDEHDTPMHEPIPGDLIAAARLGELTGVQEAELNALLRDSAAARRLYAEHMQMHAELTWERAGDRVTPTIARATPAPMKAPTPPGASSGWRIGVGIGVGIAAVLAIGVSVGVYVAMSGGEAIEPAGRVEAVAVVLDASGVAWRSEPVDAGGDVGRGVVAIASGELELELRSGVSLVLSGPTECTLDSPDRATLRRGTLSARVPAEAVGFTVEAPGFRVVDLGTAFTVDAPVSGDAIVRVTEGRVRVERLGAGATIAESLIVDASVDAVVVGAGGLVVRRVEPIGVVNGSFEEVGEGRGGEPFVAAGDVAGWTKSRGGAGSQSRRSEFSEGSPDNFAAGSIDGDRVGQANAEGGAGSALVQDVEARFEPGVEYVLSVRIGRRRDHDAMGIGPAAWRIGLHRAETDEAAGADEAASTRSGQTIVGAGGAARVHTVRFTATEADAGHRIRVVLENTGRTAGFSAVNFDEVRLGRVDTKRINTAASPDESGDGLNPR